MAKNNKWKTGGNKRVAFRKARRAMISRGNKGIIVFFGTQSIGAGTVRSLNTLLKPTQLQKDVMKELWKVQARIARLEEQGFVFQGRIAEYKAGKVHFDHMQIWELKKWTMAEIRNQAVGYRGTFGHEAIRERLKEERRLRREEKKRIREEEEAARIQEMIDNVDMEEYYPDELDTKIQNIIEDEYNYMSELMFDAGAKEGTRMGLMDTAQQIIEELQNLSAEAKKQVVDWYENNGTLQDAIDRADNKWRGLFYYGAEYNEALLFIIRQAKGDLTPDDMFTEAYNDMVPRDTDFRSVNFEWDDI